MINIFIDDSKDKKFILNVTGHTKRDVCIAVSALTNSIVQYAKDYECDKFCIAKLNYTRGNVELEIKFNSENIKNKFLNGIEGIINGYRLYENNFKSDIKIN